MGICPPPLLSRQHVVVQSCTLGCIRDTLQGLRKQKVSKKSFVWLPWQLFDNMVLFANNCQNFHEKHVIFKCFQKPQTSRCQIKLCVMIALFFYFSKCNFEVGGSARFLEGKGGKIGLNV